MACCTHICTASMPWAWCISLKSLAPSGSEQSGFVTEIAQQGIVTVLHEGSVLAQGRMDQVQADERVIDVYLGR